MCLAENHRKAFDGEAVQYVVIRAGRLVLGIGLQEEIAGIVVGVVPSAEVGVDELGFASQPVVDNRDGK